MKLLLAENRTKSTLIATLTQWGYSVVLAFSIQEIIEKLESDQEIQFVLMDSILSERCVPEFFHWMKNREPKQPIYTLLLTETNDREHIAKILDAGADDFVPKPYHLNDLFSRIKIGQISLLKESQLLKLTSDDPVTGLLNKRAVLSRLGQEIYRSQRSRLTFALAMFAVDNLGDIDQNHGLWAKDQVLKELAFFLTNGLRVYDFVGRLENDLFLLGICDINQIDALEILERIIKSVEEFTIPILTAKTRLFVNVGVSMVMPPFEDSIGAVIKRCEEAVQTASRQANHLFVI